MMDWDGWNRLVKWDGGGGSSGLRRIHFGLIIINAFGYSSRLNASYYLRFAWRMIGITFTSI